MTTATINAFDVRTPRQALDVMNAIVVTYRALAENSRSTLDAQTAQGVTGEPLAFVTFMWEAAHAVAKTAEASAAEFAREVQKLEDTVGRGAGGSLAGTQAGGYGDQGKGGGSHYHPSRPGQPMESAMFTNQHRK